MDWIAVTDKLPIYDHPVLVTDGYEVRSSHIEQNSAGLRFFQLEDTNFIVLWWTPFPGSVMEDNLNYYTEDVRNYYVGVQRQSDD